MYFKLLDENVNNRGVKFNSDDQLRKLRARKCFTSLLNYSSVNNVLEKMNLRNPI